MGERKLDEKETEMSDLEMVDFIVGAHAHKVANLSIQGKHILALIERYRLFSIDAPEEIVNDHIDNPYIQYTPLRPPQADDKYKDYDPKMVLELKQLKFYRWRAQNFGNWAERIYSWIKWTEYDAPKDLKDLVNVDHILSDPCTEEDDEYKRPDYLNEIIGKKGENNEE